MNRRHLTEGQKAVLANEYRKVLSEKAKTQRAEIANAVKYGKSSLEDTVSPKDDEEQERSRKVASDKFKVSERKVRTVQEIEKTAPKVYERLGSGDLQIHEAKIIAQLPEGKRETVLEKKLETSAKAPSPSILMAIPFIAAVAVPVAIMMILVPGLWPWIIRGFLSVLHIMRESPFPVTGFMVHYFSRDSRGLL